MATDSFVSSAAAVCTPVGALTDPSNGSATITPFGFFRIRETSGGIYLTKASTLNGAQAALSFPITRDQARDLVSGLQRFT